MIGITTSSAFSFDMSTADSGLTHSEAPVVIEAVNPDDLSFETTSMPTYEAFWTDMVDSDTVENDGEGVYVAVLDTGLLSNWQTLFSQATIRDDLGMGFSHDILYDSDGFPYLGPLKSDRGFITEYASGHGTHVTSTVVGFDLGGVWINGVAPKASIIPVLVLDAWLYTLPDGSVGTFTGGTDPMVASGIAYIGSLASQLDGPVVINMSLGGSSPSAMIRDAIAYAISQGVTIVASAGNAGSDGMGYPGGHPEVISVAAVGWTQSLATGWLSDVPEKMNTRDALGNNNQLFLASFSSRPNADLGQVHKDLDVAAPGVFIVGPYKSAFANNFGFYYLSGTSMASPHVAGIAALVLQSHPDMTQSEMEFVLKLAASGNPLPADDATVAYFGGVLITQSWDGGDYGSGFITAPNALRVAAIHS